MAAVQPILALPTHVCCWIGWLVTCVFWNFAVLRVRGSWSLCWLWGGGRLVIDEKSEASALVYSRDSVLPWCDYAYIDSCLYWNYWHMTYLWLCNWWFRDTQRQGCPPKLVKWLGAKPSNRKDSIILFQVMAQCTSLGIFAMLTSHNTSECWRWPQVSDPSYSLSGWQIVLLFLYFKMVG